VTDTLSWQASLLGAGVEPSCDPSFDGARRRFLGQGAWLDLSLGWVQGADELFERLLAAAPWSTRERPMYDRVVAEPRLSTGRWDDPPAPCDELAAALGARYGLDLSAVSANLYRDGRDSVAWHGDTLGRHRDRTVVAIVSLGEPAGCCCGPRAAAHRSGSRPATATCWSWAARASRPGTTASPSARRRAAASA
jgi:alkylated DNA repair dioxygenase AlkB